MTNWIRNQIDFVRYPTQGDWLRETINIKEPSRRIAVNRSNERSPNLYPTRSLILLSPVLFNSASSSWPFSPRSFRRGRFSALTFFIPDTVASPLFIPPYFSVVFLHTNEVSPSPLASVPPLYHSFLAGVPRSHLSLLVRHAVPPFRTSGASFSQFSAPGYRFTWDSRKSSASSIPALVLWIL